MAKKKSKAKPALPPKLGRPTDYKPDYPAMLINHMNAGGSYAAFAGLVKVSRQALYNWETAFPEFKEAKEQGEMQSLYHWEKIGQDGLYNEVIKTDDGMTINRSINATMYIFQMKNRFPKDWRDKHEVSTEVKDSSATAEVKKLADQLVRLKAIK